MPTSAIRRPFRCLGADGLNADERSYDDWINKQGFLWYFGRCKPSHVGNEMAAIYIHASLHICEQDARR